MIPTCVCLRSSARSCRATRTGRRSRNAPSSFVTDPATGRTTAELLPRFDTITLRPAVGPCAAAVAAALHDAPVHAGDRVAILGFTSVDYTIIDTALTQLGAVSRAAADQRPVGPAAADRRRDRADADRVEHRLRRRRRRADPHRPRPRAPGGVRRPSRGRRPARGVRGGQGQRSRRRSPVVVETLADVLGRGAACRTPAVVADGDDPLALLVYTSGSTGAPKGAIYPESKVANMWRAGGQRALGRQAGRPARDHAELPADEPRHGPRRPLRHAGQRRHRLLRRPQRPVDLPRGSRAGPADADELRPAHLGHALQEYSSESTADGRRR